VEGGLDRAPLKPAAARLPRSATRLEAMNPSLPPDLPRRSGGLPIRDGFSRDVRAQNLASDIRDEIINAANVAVIASTTNVHADTTTVHAATGISKEPGKRL